MSFVSRKPSFEFFDFMIVLSGSSGAVVMAVVGVLAGFSGRSGIDTYGGFCGGGQYRVRESGGGVGDEGAGSSEQIFIKTGFVDGDVDHSGASLFI